MENKIQKLRKAKERAESLSAIEESIRFKSEEVDVLRKNRAKVIHDLHGLGHIFNPQLCEEEILLNRVFGELMDKYQTENESVVYDLGVTLLRLSTFLMTAYLVVTVMNN
jgi:hypothetical protein